jgi:hypothetical protein
MRQGVRGILRRQAACSRHTKDDKQTQENCPALNVDSQLHNGKSQHTLDFRAPAFNKGEIWSNVKDERWLPVWLG